MNSPPNRTCTFQCIRLSPDRRLTSPLAGVIPYLKIWLLGCDFPPLTNSPPSTQFIQSPASSRITQVILSRAYKWLDHTYHPCYCHRRVIYIEFSLHLADRYVALSSTGSGNKFGSGARVNFLPLYYAVLLCKEIWTRKFLLLLELRHHPPR